MAGLALAGFGLAGLGLAGFGLAGLALAGFGLAGLAWAGFGLAGLALAGFSLAGLVDCNGEDSTCLCWFGGLIFFLGPSCILPSISDKGIFLFL